LNIKKSGSIIVFSLMILSIILALTQQLLRSVYVSTNFIKTMINREQAEMAALGGVNLAIVQLQNEKAKIDDEKRPLASTRKEGTEGGGEKKDPSDKKKSDPSKILLQNILPNLNKWQTFDLQETTDGVDGQIKICISSENGKLNINEAFDFKKQEFKKEYETILKALIIKDKLPAGEIHNKIVELFKNRKKKLNDISELYEISGFENLDIFYSPPKTPVGKKEKYASNGDITLQDFFTIWTDKFEIDPLLLSDSVCAVFGLRRPLANDAIKMKEKFKQLTESFNPNWGRNWDENWKHIQPIYGDKPKSIKDFVNIFSKQFGPTVYSVLSSGKVGNVEQRLLAIIKKTKKEAASTTSEKSDEKKEEGQQKEINQKEKKGGKPTTFFKVVRIYWI
jgi:hypothetical protein